MDRATETQIVVVYCIFLLAVICVFPLADWMSVFSPTPPRTPPQDPPGTSLTNTSGMNIRDPAASPYLYTTSGYESRSFYIPVDVRDPPLVVKYQFVPKNITRTKMVTSEYGRKETKLIKYEMPSEDSWLRVRILDKSGNVVDEGGYGQLPGEGRGLGNLEGKVSTYRLGEHAVEVRFNDMEGKFSF